MAGHGGHVLCLSQCGRASPVFVSGSQDRTVRFWDLRTRGCVNMVQYSGQVRPVVAGLGSGSGSGVWVRVRVGVNCFFDLI